MRLVSLLVFSIKEKAIDAFNLFVWGFSYDFPKIVLFLFLCLIPSPLASQTDLFDSPVDRIIGRSGATTAHYWSFFSNPAGNSLSKSMVVGIGYENGFNLKELSSRSAFLVYPTDIVVASGGFTQFGFRHFNIQQYSLSASRNIAPWLNMGTRFNYLLRHQTGDKNYSLFVFDAGLQVLPVESVLLGFYVVNPAQVKWGLNDDPEYHPTWGAAAVKYEASSNLFLELGVLKEIEHQPILSFSIKAPLHSLIVVRGGVSSAPLRLAIGAGINWESFMFDAGISHHPDLGFTSSFGILYKIRKM